MYLLVGCVYMCVYIRGITVYLLFHNLLFKICLKEFSTSEQYKT